MATVQTFFWKHVAGTRFSKNNKKFSISTFDKLFLCLLNYIWGFTSSHLVSFFIFISSCQLFWKQRCGIDEASNHFFEKYRNQWSSPQKSFLGFGLHLDTLFKIWQKVKAGLTCKVLVSATPQPSGERKSNNEFTADLLTEDVHQVSLYSKE